MDDWARLLIVDDDETFRLRLARAMERRGYRVEVAASGVEAVAIAKEFVPEFAVVDLRMPEVGGLEVVRRLLEIDRGVRIVVLTGFGSIATAVEAIQLGAVDYLTKPADGDQIDRALQEGGSDREERSLPIDIPSLDRVEWEHLQRALAECNHNISRTARVLGIDRRSLQRKLKKYPPAAPEAPSDE